MPESKASSLGRKLVNVLHQTGLFVLLIIVAWAAVQSLVHLYQVQKISLKDILLLFIYLELVAMIGVYYQTHRLPVQYLIFIAITALSRHLVIDVQQVSDPFHLYLLLTIALAILLLSGSLFVIAYTSSHFGRPEDNLQHDSEKEGT